MAGKGKPSGNLYWLFAILPAACVVWLFLQIPNIANQQIPQIDIAWVPELGTRLSFRLDGLSLLMSLLVLGVGALILIYASGYMDGHAKIGRFFAILIFFMVAMLGVVTANNIILLFVFWELTSISSYLLIGFDHENKTSQVAAQQALFVTGTGGLCLLAGLILLGNAAGSWELSEILQNGELIKQSSLFPMIILMVVLGAFTKSAQFPFHFWLPNAMAAPTPVSAYLHSATMVKAGIYILARLNPVLGESIGWTWTLILIGGFTALLGGWMAWQRPDLKQIMAYTTVSALGILVFLIGVGGKIGIKAMLLFLIVHSLYKGALFMTAGAIDHETGTRDINKLGKLARLMPITLAAVLAATLSMAGIPPLLGFTGKELIYEATVESHLGAVWLTMAAFAMNFFNVAAAGIIVYRPFFEEPAEDFDSSHVHEAPWTLWLGPIVLGGTALLSWIFIGSDFFSEQLFSPALSAVYGQTEVVYLYALPPVFDLIPILSILTIAAGLLFVIYHKRLLAWGGRWTNDIGAFGPEAGYFAFLDGILQIAHDFTNQMQNGYLRRYLAYVFVTLAVLTSLPLWLSGNGQGIPFLVVGQPQFQDIVLSLMIVAGALWVVIFPGRLSAIAALGVVGYGIALLFFYLNAPDLAMTQFAVETLIVIVFVLVIYKLPLYSARSTIIGRYRDWIISGIIGIVMFTLVMFVTSVPYSKHISDFYASNSYTLAKGRNIVNVILVDFRGLDTMVEVSVLAVAAIGVLALLATGKKVEEPGSKVISSLIFKTASRYLVPLILLFAVFTLLRGHNDPGGGFIAGLLAASAFVMYILAFSIEDAKELLKVRPMSLIAAGLTIALGSTLFAPLVLQQPFMEGIWGSYAIPAIGKLGTPLVFDIGVMLAVIGVVLAIVFGLAAEEDNLRRQTQRQGQRAGDDQL
ncbi:MAG: multicomponent Na+:H+ antiporter subunit A [Cellvibrionaceae bacterium]